MIGIPRGVFEGIALVWAFVLLVVAFGLLSVLVQALPVVGIPATITLVGAIVGLILEDENDRNTGAH